MPLIGCPCRPPDEGALPGKDMINDSITVGVVFPIDHYEVAHRRKIRKGFRVETESSGNFSLHLAVLRRHPVKVPGLGYYATSKKAVIFIRLSDKLRAEPYVFHINTLQFGNLQKYF